MKDLLSRFFFGGAGGANAVADFGLLVLRAVAGLALAFGHGINKLPPSVRFIERTGELGFPFPVVFAWSAAFAEFLGGLLLVVGLATRPAATFIALTMLVAVFGAHAGDPFSDRELATLFLGVALLFVATGSGRFGLDHLVRRTQRTFIRRRY